MYDAIVVGTGPAGCTASKVLAEKGNKVLLVEKFRLPRFRLEYFFLAKYNRA